MRVVVTGGCGYVGSVLVPKLLEAGHFVRVVDSMLFGNYLKPHDRLIVDKADIRDKFALDCDAVIHLAGIANDPTGDLDPKLTWEVNALATQQLADRCSRSGVARFIYASSGSVYGVSEEPEVTEEVPLVPISEYNKTKMVAERCVLSYSDKMIVQVLRPATVCGVSPRQRLDVVVNIMASQAATRGVVTFQGGTQMRPNIHIEDMTDLYLFMLDHPEHTGVFNAGFENLTVREIAKMAADKVGCRLSQQPIVDPRSYRLNSAKLLATGFKPKKTVANAIDEVIGAFKSGSLKEDVKWHNIKSMKTA